MGILFWRLSIFLCDIYFSPAARGDRFAGGSLVTFAAILVRLQAKREGVDYFLASFDILMPHIFLPGCAGGTGLPAAL